uniref:5-oxoprolinase subunit PxpB n=1 Tax=Oleiagrimonas sp. TaxID=2010330 RepID=UPI002623BF4A
NARVHRLCDAIGQAGLQGLQDMVPAYASVLLRFDPARSPAADCLRARLLDIAGKIAETGVTDEAQADTTLHRIPVCYGGEHGPDMARVEAITGLDRADIIRLHCAAEYRVAMIGFAPGFAYLLGLDPKLHVPRRDQPRTRVPRGSVALGGAQTGVYPSELPGGWQLIGHTHLALFDAGNEDRPSRLAPGDRVRFEAIDEQTWKQHSPGEHA